MVRHLVLCLGRTIAPFAADFNDALPGGNRA